MQYARKLAAKRIAEGRPSIAARPGTAGRLPTAARVLVLALSATCAPPIHPQGLQGELISPAISPTLLGPTVPLPAETPSRPQISVPYDGAIAAYRAGRTDEALSLAERALRDDPRNPQLRFLRGVVLADRQRDDEAMAAFRSLVQDFPELAEPHNNLAVVHARRGEWDAARQALEQSIRAVPSYALAHENLGDVHLQLAALAYERAGRLDPRSPSARGKLALSRELIGRLQPATESSNPRPGANTQAKPQ